MPLNRDFIGRTFETSGEYDVSRETIRRFALAIGDLNPLYLDPDAARAQGHDDVVAPPTFLTSFGFRFPDDAPTFKPELGLDYSLVVHGEQRFAHHRPVRPGDRLKGVTVVEDIRDVGRNESMVVRTDIVSVADDEPVASMWATVISRGTAAPKEGS